MGANQQTSVPAFTSGQVLTAQQQTEINTGVPVFADSTARDAAFGGTGEKVLAQGQLAYLEDSDIVQYYDGSVWATLAPSPPTPSGLVFLAGNTFTTATSVSLPDNTFSATYRIYKMLFVITGGSASAATMTGRLRASGSDDTASNYRNMNVGINTAAGADSLGSAATSFGYGSNYSNLGLFRLMVDVLDPQQTEKTGLLGTSIGLTADGNNFVGRNIAQTFNATTSFDSFTLISSVASGMTGFFRVYGYADS